MELARLVRTRSDKEVAASISAAVGGIRRDRNMEMPCALSSSKAMPRSATASSPSRLGGAREVTASDARYGVFTADRRRLRWGRSFSRLAGPINRRSQVPAISRSRIRAGVKLFQAQGYPAKGFSESCTLSLTQFQMADFAVTIGYRSI